MARKRMIDPSIWTDEGMATLTPRQQLLFIGLFSNADDEGRLRAAPQALRLMMPTIYHVSVDPDSEVESDLMAICCQIRQLSLYEVDGRSYLAFHSYARWQRIDRPSKSAIPPPPQLLDEGSTSHRRMVDEPSMSTPAKEREKLEKLEKLEEEKLEKEGGGADAPPPREAERTESASSEEPEPRRTRTKLAPFLTEEERVKLHAEFDSSLGSKEVADWMEHALTHDAARKIRGESWYRYVRLTWLKRESDKVEAKRGAGPRSRTAGADNGRNAAAAGSGAARGAPNGTIDPGARDPRELRKLGLGP